MKKHVIIRLTGKVQGVSFRMETRYKANDLRVKGFVRNEPDGSLYIEAEGEEADVSALTTWCVGGPPLAKVETIQVDKGEVKGYEGFEISR